MTMRGSNKLVSVELSNLFPLLRLTLVGNPPFQIV